MPDKETLPENRRYDSIATLIQLDGQDCGAACFDKENLVFATNHQKPPNLLVINAVKRYMRELAQEGEKFKEELQKSKHTKFSAEERKKIYAQLKENSKKNAAAIIAAAQNFPFYTENTDYQARFLRAIEKIRRSISLAYLAPSDKQAWPNTLTLAIARNKMEFIPGQSGVHAELKIAQHLYDNNKIKYNKRYYFGISKRCCYGCENVIKAVNRLEKTNIIEVRDEGHQGKYPAAIPRFLSENPELQATFKDITGRDVVAAFPKASFEHPAISQQHSESDDNSSASFRSEKSTTSSLSTPRVASAVEHETRMTSAWVKRPNLATQESTNVASTSAAARSSAKVNVASTSTAVFNNDKENHAQARVGTKPVTKPKY